MRQALWLGMAARWSLLVLIAGALLHALSPAARADVFRMLPDDRESFQARVDLIQQAKCQIDVAYYAIDCSESALAFLTLLREASDRGVRVRLLVDALINRIPATMKAHLIAHGVEIREFHPVMVLRPCRMNQRMHDKLLIVDCEQMILGSRNLRNSHFSLDPCTNYVNRDAYVRGCAARSAAGYFDCHWNSREVGPPEFKDRWGDRKFHRDECDACNALLRGGSPAQAGAILDRALNKLQTDGWMRMHTGYDWAAGERDVPVRFLYDPPVPGKTPFRGIEVDIERYFDQACHCILIESPFLVMPHSHKRKLKAAIRRGVRVCIITNSISSVDSVLAQAQYENEKRALLRAGFELWEFRGPDHLHAKAAVIDGQIALLGSYNFDARSDSHNSEVAVAVFDAESAGYLAALMREHIDRSYQLGRRGWPIGAGVRHPGATRAQLRKVQTRRLVSPFIRRFL